MKHSIKYLTMVITMLLSMLVFTACPDKPYEGDDPTPNPPQPTKTVQLSSIETIYNDGTTTRSIFEYDENNRIKSIRDSWTYSSGNNDDYTLTEFFWDPFSIIWEDKKVNVTLSPAGYITYAKAWAETDYNTYEYDKAGHLIRETCNDEDYYEEIIYTWRDGLLVEVEENLSDEDYWEKSLSVISYGGEHNKTGIWPASFCECELLYFEPGDYDSPCVLQTGLLGVAPTRLPVSVSREVVYDDGDHSERKYKISPQLDAEGRLLSETIEENAYGMTHSYRLKYNYR